MNAYNFDMLFYALNGRSPGPGLTGRADFDIYTPSKRLPIPFLQKELVARIENSIATNLALHTDPIISLSAGYDATTILAACVKLGIKVKTFSYGSEDCPKNSDVRISKDTAMRFGVKHDIWPMNHFSTEEIQVKNAAFFEKRANRCDELGAWMFFAGTSSDRKEPRPFFIFGDECFGWRACRIRTNSDLLLSIGVQPTIHPIQEFLNKDIMDEFSEAYHEELNRIIGRAVHLDRWHDKKDFLYFHERIQKVILPWRACFAARFGNYATPLLDRHILEFISTLPGALRMNKALMRSAVRTAYPEYFRSRRATNSGAPSLAKVGSFSGDMLETMKKYAFNSGLNSNFINTIQGLPHAISDIVPKKGLKQTFKSHLNSIGFGSSLRRMIPPVYYCHKEYALSRLQIWLLREAMDNGHPITLPANGSA